jgi:hypothetical protein
MKPAASSLNNKGGPGQAGVKAELERSAKRLAEISVAILVVSLHVDIEPERPQLHGVLDCSRSAIRRCARSWFCVLELALRRHADVEILGVGLTLPTAPN